MKHLIPHATAWRIIISLAAAGCLNLGTATAQQPDAKASKADIQRGRYLVRITGCNDCHTPGYPESNGKTDEKLWLTGSPLGWRGPWGTTYAPNLRLVVQNLTEAQWLKHARTEWRPPMPWFNLREMTDADLKAMYRYIRHLGPAGEPAPAYVPPNQTPKQPFVQFPAPPK
jgi:mono/diheme cytochrome c family protein